MIYMYKGGESVKARFCSVCGKERVNGSSFCGHCGGKFEDEAGVGLSMWFYMDHDEINGPLPIEDMNALEVNGVIHRDTLVKKDGSEKWVSLAESNLSAQEETSATQEVSVNGITDQVKDVFFQATEKVNSMVGERGNINLKLSDVFSAVFQKHSKEEGELLFISGTSVTTPEESEISTSWPKPWLFSRVFLILAATYILLYICTFTFGNLNAVPGLIVIGAFAVPFSLLIFFWETNAPRNISIFEVVKMFFVGGVASLVATLFIFSFFPVYQLNYTGAITVGVIEEVGKLVIVAFFIKQLKVKFILNGLLIGAAIGAGFAAFESAGYAFNLGWMYGDEALKSIIVDRAWLSVGGHVVWAAISGAALVYVKGDQPLNRGHFTDPRFIKLFMVPIALHAIWNSPLYFLHGFYFLYLVLIVVAWIFIFTFINAGLNQISRLNDRSIAEREA